MNKDFKNNFEKFNIDSDINSNIEDLQNSSPEFFIDIENINTQAEEASIQMCLNLEKIYGNKRLMTDFPDYKKRLDIEIENLRLLIKMKKSDEAVHDIAVSSICNDSGNASMYMSLIRVQSSILDIQRRMDDIIKNINNLLRCYQTEFNFNEQHNIDNDNNSTQNENKIDIESPIRGSRAFIYEINKQQKDSTIDNIEDIEDTTEDILETFDDL